MSNTRKKPSFYVVSLSGGKDSTAMLLRLIEEGRQIDEILFADTGMEFPQMYEHLDKLEKYIGRPICRIKADKDFEYYFSEYTPSRQDGSNITEPGKSWPDPRVRWCNTVLKTKVIRNHLYQLRKTYKVIQYIGIAADEPERIKTVKSKQYPLVDWGMTEADCLQYCYDRGFDWGGIYNIKKRVSCWCCPLQTLNELRSLYHYFPDLWNKLKTMDARTWRQFRKDFSVDELDRRFVLEDEWINNGKNINTMAFKNELRKLLNK